MAMSVFDCRLGIEVTAFKRRMNVLPISILLSYGGKKGAEKTPKDGSKKT